MMETLADYPRKSISTCPTLYVPLPHGSTTHLLMLKSSKSGNTQTFKTMTHFSKTKIKQFPSPTLTPLEPPI